MDFTYNSTIRVYASTIYNDTIALDSRGGEQMIKIEIENRLLYAVMIIGLMIMASTYGELNRKLGESEGKLIKTQSLIDFIMINGYTPNPITECPEGEQC